MIPEEWGKDLADSMPKFRFMVERTETGAKVFDTHKNRDGSGHGGPGGRTEFCSYRKGLNMNMNKCDCGNEIEPGTTMCEWCREEEFDWDEMAGDPTISGNTKTFPNGETITLHYGTFNPMGVWISSTYAGHRTSEVNYNGYTFRELVALEMGRHGATFDMDELFGR